jgi:membrane-bound serine protease (ClpP class)
VGFGLPLGAAEVTVDPTVAGVALMILAIALVVGEIHLPTYGIFTAAALAAAIAAALLLFDTDSDEVSVSIPILLAGAAALIAFAAFAARKAVEASRAAAHTGWEELVGAEGEVREALDPAGQVFVHGALWRARIVTGSGSLERGSRVRVESVDGLTLVVTPVPPEGDG